MNRIAASMKLSVTGLTALVFLLWIARPSEAGDAAPADNATPILRTPTFLDYLHSEQPGEDKLLYGGAEYDAMTEGTVTLRGLRELQGALDPAGFNSILELVQRRGGLKFGRIDFRRFTGNFKAPLGIDMGAFELRIAENQRRFSKMRARAEVSLNHFRANLQPLRPELDPLIQESQIRLHQLEDESEATSAEAIQTFERNIAELKCRQDEKLKDMDAARTKMDERLQHSKYKVDALAAKNEIRLVELRAKLDQLKTKADLRRHQLESKRKSLPPQMIANDSKSVSARLSPLELSSGEESMLSWDEWYARVAEKVRKPLIQAINNHGNPAGENTIRITVWPDHRLSVVIERSSNPEFDGAIVDAYTSIDRDPDLAFPTGSRRSIVSYLTDHIHLIGTPPSQVTARKLTGDNEVISTP